MILNEDNPSAGRHTKHAAIKRPANGNYNRNEWAVIGGHCIAIKLLADSVIKALSSQYKCAYADTAHNDDINLLPGRLPNGAVSEYVDQVNYSQLNYTGITNPFTMRQIFAGADLVLINGNHQQAKAQVIIIDESKRASLQKRVAQLTNVRLILLADNATGVFDFVKDAVPNWQQLPIYRLDETEQIVTFFKSELQKTKPVINGLVLAGGKSQRMGFDKGAVNWHGKQQRYYVADMLKPFSDQVYISCRADQQSEIDDNYLTLPDTFTGLGPYGAILSALRENPDSAWLVIACDLPLMEAETLQYLFDNRNTSTIATTYQSAFDAFPEPLITIWEPKSYPVLLSFLGQGYSCPRKVLINSDITILQPPNPDALTNVNTPDELDKVKRILHQKIAAE